MLYLFIFCLKSALHIYTYVYGNTCVGATYVHIPSVYSLSLAI